MMRVLSSWILCRMGSALRVRNQRLVLLHIERADVIRASLRWLNFLIKRQSDFKAAHYINKVIWFVSTRFFDFYQIIHAGKREKTGKKLSHSGFSSFRVSLFCQLELQELRMDQSWCQYGSYVACFHFLLHPWGAPEPWSATLTAFTDDLQALVPAAIRQWTLWCSYRCFLTWSVGLFSNFSLLRGECVLLLLQCLIWNARWRDEAFWPCGVIFILIKSYKGAKLNCSFVINKQTLILSLIPWRHQAFSSLL